MFICRNCLLEMNRGQMLVVVSNLDRTLGELYTCPSCDNLIIQTRDNALVHDNLTGLPVVNLKGES